MHRAQAAAVDASWVEQQSRKILPLLSNPRKLVSVTTSTPIPNPSPSIMILESSQPLRMTRPFISKARLLHYPFEKTRLSTLNSTECARCCPIFEINSSKLKQKDKGSRKKVKSRWKERPQPTFWYPNPLCGGQSLGYGVGHTM